MVYRSGDFVELVNDSSKRFMVVQARFDGWTYEDDGSYSKYTLICKDNNGNLLEKNPDEIRYANHAERWGLL